MPWLIAGSIWFYLTIIMPFVKLQKTAEEHNEKLDEQNRKIEELKLKPYVKKYINSQVVEGNSGTVIIDSTVINSLNDLSAKHNEDITKSLVELYNLIKDM